MNLITDPIRDHITTADEHQLRRISRHVIPHTKGITDAEREALKQRVLARYAELNAQAGYGSTRLKNPLIVAAGERERAAA